VIVHPSDVLLVMHGSMGRVGVPFNPSQDALGLKPTHYRWGK
jgi:hypothetical protein